MADFELHPRSESNARMALSDRSPESWNQTTAVLTQPPASALTRPIGVCRYTARMTLPRLSGARRGSAFLFSLPNPLVIILLFAGALSAITGDTASFSPVVSASQNKLHSVELEP
jgi:hypothetical protein